MKTEVMIAEEQSIPTKGSPEVLSWKNVSIDSK